MALLCVDLYSGISFLGSQLSSGCKKRKRNFLSICGHRPSCPHFLLCDFSCSSNHQSPAGNCGKYTFGEGIASGVCHGRRFGALQSPALHSLLCKLALLPRIKRRQGDTGVVSAFFPCICLSDRGIYPGAETALPGGCGGRNPSGGTGLAFLSKKKQIQKDHGNL